MTQAVDFAGYVVENKAYVVEKNYIRPVGGINLVHT